MPAFLCCDTHACLRLEMLLTLYFCTPRLHKSSHTQSAQLMKTRSLTTAARRLSRSLLTPLSCRATYRCNNSAYRSLSASSIPYQVSIKGRLSCPACRKPRIQLSWCSKWWLQTCIQSIDVGFREDLCKFRSLGCHQVPNAELAEQRFGSYVPNWRAPTPYTEAQTSDCRSLLEPVLHSIQQSKAAIPGLAGHTQVVCAAPPCLSC